ncbi:hypothetical protein BKA59DRAFT_487306 [Fusarium tricinctum]|uniref:CBM-cenC domain-containing protein n=1 Tax=Fusarium tricinctum TaxID=61284 RepID=A0A8K0W8C4_9HYPO|nr:hypothetical protein BKA59DRAFT_487306 [Fusarium tricinctum]
MWPKMILNTIVVAFTAMYFMGVSEASPCKVSSRTIESSVTSGIFTTVTSADISTATTSATYLSSTKESSVIVTESEHTTETSIADKETTTVSITTTESTSTHAAATTDSTTTTEAAIPTFIRNAGFEDSAVSLHPWRKTNEGQTVASVVSDFSHDGQNSVRMTWAAPAASYIAQDIQNPVMAGVVYTMSAWVNISPACFNAILMCTYGIGSTAKSQTFPISASMANQWMYISSTCTFTQGQIDVGSLVLQVGLTCVGGGGYGYYDTVDFST